MQRHVIVALLIVSIMSSTMVVGCTGGSIVAGLGMEVGIVLLQFVGALALDQFVGPLFGDPAGDLGGGGTGGGDEPPDD